MLSEAWHAAEILAARDMQIRILNFPWLNRVDQAWLSEAVGGTRCVITIDDHYRAFGQGGVIAAALAGHIPVICLGFDEIPVSGQNSEVLAYHKLDRTALAERIAVEAKQ
jgi:transketolase C-terminal domain/subunit